MASARRGGARQARHWLDLWHVEKHFQPQVLDPEATYAREIECCEACERCGGECLAHREVGKYHDAVFTSLARAMRIFQRDPEQLGALLYTCEPSETEQEATA